MKDFDELKSLWGNQVVHPKISAEDVIKRIKKTKNLLAGRILRDCISFSLASIAIIWMWFVTDFRMWTTHVVILIFLICCLYYMILQIMDYRMINNETLIDKPEDYINRLKKYKHDRYILNTRTYRNYIFLLSIGFALYLIEIFFVSNLLTVILGAIFTLFWIAFCYFIVMKRYISKEENKVNEMINNLERLKQQFVEEEVS